MSVFACRSFQGPGCVVSVYRGHLSAPGPSPTVWCVETSGTVFRRFFTESSVCDGAAPTLPARAASAAGFPRSPSPTTAAARPGPAARFRGRHSCPAPLRRGSARSSHPGSLPGPVSPLRSGWQGVTSSHNATHDKNCTLFPTTPLSVNLGLGTCACVCGLMGVHRVWGDRSGTVLGREDEDVTCEGHGGGSMVGWETTLGGWGASQTHRAPCAAAEPGRPGSLACQGP